MSYKLVVYFRKTPFKLSDKDSTESLLVSISESKISFDENNWKYVSNDAKVKI
jgi:hypothetical protein